MTPPPGAVDDGPDRPQVRCRQSSRLFGGLVAAVIAAQLLNLGLQWLRPPAPPQMLSDPSVLADRRAPTLGAVHVDETIYLFSDYACPSYRAMYPDLLELVASDKRVPIVYRDWPVLSPRSIRAARLAIASASHGRHAKFDDALMRHGGSLDEATLQSAAARAGVDWRRLLSNYAAHRSEIDGLIADSGRYARAFGFVRNADTGGRSVPRRWQTVARKSARARRPSPHGPAWYGREASV